MPILINIYCNECTLQVVIVLQESMMLGGIFDVPTTRNLNLPLFPVGLLLRLQSKAVRCLLPSKCLCFPIQDLVYSLL